MAENSFSSLRQSLEKAQGALLEIAKGRSPEDFKGEFSGGEGRRDKSLSTTSLVTGGELDAEQSTRFEQYIRGSSDMMDAADVQVVNSPKGQIDSVYLTNMITKKATESSTLTETASVLLGNDDYETVETYAALDVTHKLLTRNIEKEQFANTVIDMVVQAVGKDYSYASVNGNLLSANPNLSYWDGYKIQSDKGRVLSAGGANISYDIFAAANDAFSDDKRRYMSNSLRWFGHSRMWANWDKDITTRVGTLSDSVLGGASAASPLGIKPLICNEIPTNIAVPTSAATPCTVLGTVHGPFAMVSGYNTINLNINSAGATVYTVPLGVYQPAQFANTLNALLVADGKPAIVNVDQLGRIYLQTPTTGIAATIVITHIATDMTTALGLTDGAYAGLAPATTNTVTEGTYMWLTDPKNFWFGVLNSLRLYWEYVPRGNKWELTIFSEGIPYLRDSDAIVTVEDIRLRKYLV